MHQFSIITPTYNRAEFLPAIFESLKNQGEHIDLEWIIIDDGSTDNTKEIVSQFESPFNIIYKYQENAGKPAALNTGIMLADSHIIRLLDSDDSLLPNSLPDVWQYYNSATGLFKENCVCLSGLCIYNTGEIIGDKFPVDYYVSNHIEYRTNKNIKGDKAEFVLTSILKQYLFPVMENEKRITVSFIWNRLAQKYKTLYVNKTFVEKAFLKGGFSDQPIWENNPHSSELFFNEATNPMFKFKIRLKHSIRYIEYARKNRKKISMIYSSACNKSIFAPALFLYFCLAPFLRFKSKKGRNSDTWKKIT